MKRPLFGVLLAAAFAFGLACAAAAAWGSWSSEAPYDGECPPRDVPLGRDKSLGVNTDLSYVSSDTRRQTLDSMQSLGLRWVRQRFAWDRIEPQPGMYDWALWDAIVSDVLDRGMELIAVLDGSPSWSREGDDLASPLAPPRETSDFGAFVAAFASRYADQIDFYQMWDEPNIAPHWGSRWVDPKAYGRLLREGAIQLRAADPGAVVLLAALAPNVEAGGANMSDIAFLDALYSIGAAEWFDIVAAEPYGFDFEPRVASSPGRLSFTRAEQLREVMLRHGDLNTPVWATAFGWRSATGSGLTVTESLQEAVAYARASWPWMGPMLWAAWSPEDAQGLYALAGPSAEGADFRDVLKALCGDASLMASSGWYPPDHRSGQYEGRWRVTTHGADIGATGDRLTITFTGTRIDLTLRKGAFRGFLYVTVDGQPASALPQDRDGRSYLVLYDPQENTTSVTLATGLPDRRHVAEVVADGGWGQWAIVGWQICSEESSAVPWLPIGLTGSVAVILPLALWSVWRHRLALRDGVAQLAEKLRAADPRIAWAIGAAASLCLYALPGTGLTLAALALLAAVIFLRPEVGLWLIASALPFWQPGKPFLGKVFSMVEILTWLTAAAWLACQVLGVCERPRAALPSKSATNRPFARMGALDWGVAALILVGLLSLLWAGHTREAVREFRTVLWSAALFYFLIRALARDEASRWRVVDSWVLGGALVSMVALGQWFLGRDLIQAEGVFRVRGLYGSPNNLALYLGRMLPLAVAVGLWHAGGLRRWLYGAAALLFGVATLLTYSRGAWLLGVPAALLCLAAARGRRTLLVAVGLLLSGAVVGVLLVGPGRVASLADLTQGTAYLRLQLWQSSVAMIRDHFFFGVGLDGFLYAYRSTYVLPTAWEELNLSHPHNIVLDFWLRLGLPGLVVLGYVVAAFFRKARCMYRRCRASECALALGLLAGMVDVLAHGLVDNAFFLVDLALAFVLLLAIVQNAEATERSDISHQPME